MFQTIVNVENFGLTAGEAVSATRFHHQLVPPDEINYSPNHPLSEEAASELMARGYRLAPLDYIGDVQLILRSSDSIQPGSDDRGRGESRLID